MRKQFADNGVLANSQDSDFRAVSDRWPVFGLAHNLGNVNAATSPVIYTVGHVRDPAIQYIVAGGALQDRSSYFWTAFNSVDDVVHLAPSLFLRFTLTCSQIASFISDYSAALGRANAFDSKLNSDASRISSDYAGIVALSVRQTFGATELTVSRGADGAFNASDITMFMKGVSLLPSVLRTSWSMWLTAGF